MGTIDSDDFNRADSTTTMGSTSGGRAWTPHATAGSDPVLGISSNRGYFVTSEVGAKALIDIGRTDRYRLTVTLSVAGAASGLIFRHEDDPGSSAIVISWTGVSTALIEHPDGVQTTWPTTFSNGDVMSAELSGHSIEVFKNGSSVGAPYTTLASSRDAYTRVGLYSDQNIFTRFDNFLAESLGGWTVGYIGFP